VCSAARIVWYCTSDSVDTRVFGCTNCLVLHIRHRGYQCVRLHQLSGIAHVTVWIPVCSAALIVWYCTSDSVDTSVFGCTNCLVLHIRHRGYQCVRLHQLSGTAYQTPWIPVCSAAPIASVLQRRWLQRNSHIWFHVTCERRPEFVDFYHLYADLFQYVDLWACI